MVGSTGERVASHRPPGMHDVARMAGVSHQTVSRVLNGHPSVRPTTRDRVLAAIKDLDYRRNLAARALVTGRSQTLGVVSFDTTLYGPASTLYGIEQAARDAGYFVAIASLKSIDRSSVLEALDRLMSLAVDGIIVIAPQVAAVKALADLPQGVSVVVTSSGGTPDLPAVGVDQETGATLATQHLLDHGHTQVWHIAGPPGWLEARARERAWRATMESGGGEAPDAIAGDWSAQSGYAAAKRLVKKRGLSAIFAANDHMALGALRALTEAGIRVPEDVSLVGFDDVPESAFLSPPLTTVRQDFDELGRRSLAMLLDHMSGAAGAADRATVAVKLVVRNSVATRSS